MSETRVSRRVLIKKLQDRYPIPLMVKWKEVDDGWMNDAACADSDPQLFFNETDPTEVEAALKVCGSCPVRLECYNYAMTLNIDNGIWGGTTPSRRKEIRRDALRLAN